MFPPLDAYCHLIAELPAQFPLIRSSTLTAYTIGPGIAEIQGQLCFPEGYVLDVWELLDLPAESLRAYSYELDRAGERIWWYDPTEHPGDESLRSTFPHHKHTSPDLKHHRVPAPDLSFARPNLPVLIQEIQQLVAGSAHGHEG